MTTASAADGSIAGRVTDPQGKPVAGARVAAASVNRAAGLETRTSSDGQFTLAVSPGTWKVVATAAGLADAEQSVSLTSGEELIVDLQFARIGTRNDSLTVTADITVTVDIKEADIQRPDPAQRILVRDEVLDANPGRPGAPVSIPGLPIEAASSGIKAPQYFAPGVAGDHGEPIAQFIRVGSFLMPNNLSANAHGNGYSDPNIMVPAIIESVETAGPLTYGREIIRSTSRQLTRFAPRWNPLQRSRLIIAMST